MLGKQRKVKKALEAPRTAGKDALRPKSGDTVKPAVRKNTRKGPEDPVAAKGGESRKQQLGRGHTDEDHGGREGDSPQPETSGNRQPTFGKNNQRHKS